MNPGIQDFGNLSIEVFEFSIREFENKVICDFCGIWKFRPSRILEFRFDSI